MSYSDNFSTSLNKATKPSPCSLPCPAKRCGTVQEAFVYEISPPHIHIFFCMSQHPPHIPMIYPHEAF
ncbi:unnamed protein product [Cyprideis torosa]|uniref:Uncharacterized protein n=1 Tax=Cyprideis torosa TaxID=163714 RepID=A0A7R8WRN6_9CRUS|nr:unnamed protein product [Cyprideis torosa]CAG0908879.1 unnamed protein product [Cyprideis torosa]